MNKILIVDDSQLMRKVLRDICVEEKLGDVYEASNGQEAIAIFEKESPQLVFLDVIMPEVSGMDVLKLIGGKTNVFVVSAIGQIALIEEAQKLGAKGYIVKPFEKSDILKKIQQYIPQS